MRAVLKLNKVPRVQKSAPIYLLALINLSDDTLYRSDVPAIPAKI